MKISQDLRDFAKENGLDTEEDAIQKGFEEKSKEFRQKGAEVYLEQ